MTTWGGMVRRSSGKEVRKEDEQLVKVEWDVGVTCDEYCTAWITYTIGDESFRKRARLYKSCYSGLWVTNEDFWAVLRYMIGEELINYRKEGYITINKLKRIIKETEHFYSETWDRKLHDFAWQNHYCSNTKNWISDFMEKVRGEYKEGSSLVGMF